MHTDGRELPGSTQEQRAIVDAQVRATGSALAVLEGRLEKTIPYAPANRIISVTVAEVGKNIRAAPTCCVNAVRGRAENCHDWCGTSPTVRGGELERDLRAIE